MSEKIVKVIYNMCEEPYGGYHKTAVRGCSQCDVVAYSITDFNSPKGYIGRCHLGGFSFVCEECICECALCTSDEWDEEE
tara:strand:- start:4540 stop:4779 length:240 start_codon:yes stop_codon:yes gene_type:complete